MKHGFQYIDFRQAMKGNNLPRKYYPLNNKDNVERIIKLFPRPWIVFLGSGDYHYLSYFLIKNLSNKPYLILFDNHFDMNYAPDGMLSCGSWVREALIDDLIKGVLVIGASSMSKPTNFWHPGIIHITNPNDIINLNKYKNLFKYDLYISIDKDVLDPSVLRTDWDQGKMKEDTLLRWLSEISSKGKVVGVDLCGDFKQDPILELIDIKNKKAHERINREIIRLFTENYSKTA
ncbi:arginase family protein [Caloranaerobacter sp. DY30410]|uniref:arginase family protein n=1 Tax=Caloranaerobacter sp. DY30410 TaxID=3238305 RepID=UPI003D021877